MFDTNQEMDKIVIKDLCANCIIGVYEHERQEPQPILINITIFTNTHKAATTDIPPCRTNRVVLSFRFAPVPVGGMT